MRVGGVPEVAKMGSESEKPEKWRGSEAWGVRCARGMVERASRGVWGSESNGLIWGEEQEHRWARRKKLGRIHRRPWGRREEEEQPALIPSRIGRVNLISLSVGGIQIGVHGAHDLHEIRS